MHLQLKDLDNALEIAHAAGLKLPLTEKTRDAFHVLSNEMKKPRNDHSAFMLWLEAINPGKRLGDQPDREP